MTWPLSSTRSPIGIDVGARHIKALQLHREGGRWQVSAATSVPRIEPQQSIGHEEVDRFVGLLDRQAFTGRNAVLAVAPSAVVGGILELPSRQSGAPLDKIAQMELARMRKRQPDSFKTAIWDLPAAGRDSSGTQVMAVGCGHGDAEAILDLFEPAGLNVLALDTVSWCLARACRSQVKTGDLVTGILDLGWGSARLVVLYQDVIVYERTIADGGVGSLHQSLVERTGMASKIVDHLIEEQGVAASRQDDQRRVPELAETVEAFVDQIAHELRTSFSYTSHRYRGSESGGLILTGGGACVAGLSRHLADAVDFEVHTAMLEQLVPCAPALDQYVRTPNLAVALGLALHDGGAS